ncbi:MAG TPA: glycosyltransferase family 4 protein [Nocardioides sp.]|jgi:glycosyltransferase involved in cell wall biosynthesis|nr:glycosyltransferase family 4 protein [Nocardioides sp.]
MTTTPSALPAPRAPHTVYAVLPDGIDDPTRPSGGNVYDRRVLRGQGARGRRVIELPVAGDWPNPVGGDRERLDASLATVPDGEVVLVDGLVASGAAEVMPRHAGRLRVVVLLHMPIGPDRGEERVLASAAAVVTTSAWSREQVRSWYALPRVDVALPGVDPVEPVPPHGSAAGGTAFLCVGAVHPNKGHDLLFEALASLGDRAWTLTCVGSLDADPDHASALQTQVYARSWERRVVFTGPLSGRALGAAYDVADLLVLPSRSESYGMVIVEALAHGRPVVATAVGGVPEALGGAPVGALPGMLVAPEDPDALAGALRAWLDDPALRERLGRVVAGRRPTLRRWTETVADLDAVLERVAARPLRRSGASR